MRRRGFSERAIAAALAVENAERCQPPLDAAEVATIAASVARYPPEPPPSRFVFGGSRESTVRVAGVEVAVRPREGRRG